MGTDSQSYSETRIVTVIALQHIGKGGIFFYNLDIIPRIARVRDKLVRETQLSLDYTQQIMDAFDRIKQVTGWDYESVLDFSIHVDAGKNGASSEVIPTIIGWVHAVGYAVLTKPESWVASCIADRISK